MKHCPQCEFTFDDQEQVCDFDGTELTPVPETPPSSKSATFAPTSGSFVRSVVKSRAGVAALALAGGALSGLLIGYYDSVNQPNADLSVSQTRNDTASIVPSTQVDTMGQVETQADRPRSISTQRGIGADELPASMVKRLREGSSSRSAKSRRGESTTKMVATNRGSSSPKLVATTRKPANASRQSQARNQARPGSRERGRQQHSVAGVANRPPVWSAKESAHYKKDSKVVAILKKTGKILKRPFLLIAGR